NKSLGRVPSVAIETYKAKVRKHDQPWQTTKRVQIHRKPANLSKPLIGQMYLQMKFIKGLNLNSYATRKSIAQGMLDLALLTANASQLKYILTVGETHEFYHFLLVMIIVSISLQVGK
uniref:Uncharacterized protein n=1 Tax=Anopheles farauti TaxID=69004 RepID=A0A182Q4H2_9DIPT